MASILTGLAFMHGHIVDRELILRLGREAPPGDRGAGAPLPLPSPGHGTAALPPHRPSSPPVGACATC